MEKSDGFFSEKQSDIRCRKGYETMRQKLLHDNWQMTRRGINDWIPAVVPGSVYGDLLANGRMDDPYYRDNELKALEIIGDDFEYVTHFDVPEDFLKEEKLILRFDGIDTIADIMLNGTFLGHTENMHRIFEYSVRELLKPEDNELRVLLFSPTRYLEQVYEKQPIEGSSDAMRGFPYLRKAHCMFGWDWGPRLPDAGIWRDVSLLAFSGARFDSVYITQEHHDGIVDLNFQIDLEETFDSRTLRLTDQGCYQAAGGQLLYGADGKNLPADPEHTSGYFYKITVTDPDGCSRSYGESPSVIAIEDPKLWWPNGYGDQPLYGIKAELWEAAGEEVRLLDTWERRIGLRTMTMHLEKDAWGEQFAHEVNGVRIFAMGGDYIPEDNLLGRVTKERTYELLKQARDAHFNCIRVWGGGNYPYDGFWDACDELGLIVWEDFMFACAVYDLTPEFEENITQEFIDGIQNEYLAEVVSRYPNRFFVCGMCEFRKPGFLEQAKALMAEGFKAIKIPAQRLLLKEGRVMLNNEEMMAMFHYMEERNVILSIDLADGATQVPEMEEIIQECPRLKIAIGHFGMVTLPDWKEQIKLARHPNVMIESGGITWLFNDEFYPFKGAVKAIREAADLVGIEKLMWGSDYPRTITAITYKMSYDFVVKSPELSEGEKTLFLGENAREFYGFAGLPTLPYIKNMSE